MEQSEEKLVSGTGHNVRFPVEKAEYFRTQYGRCRHKEDNGVSQNTSKRTQFIVFNTGHKSLCQFGWLIVTAPKH